MRWTRGVLAGAAAGVFGLAVIARFGSAPPRRLERAHPHLVLRIGGIHSGDELGHNVAACDDVDRDGVGDWLVGAPSFEAERGRAQLVSGRTGRVLRTWEGSGPGTTLGHATACPGDLDGDGGADVVIGLLDSRDRGGAGGGVIAASAATGRELWAMTSPQPDDHFGARVIVLGDVTGDGVADIVAGAPGLYDTDRPGRIAIIDGRSGTLVRSLRGPELPQDRFGFALARMPDIDDDGVPDLAVGALHGRPERPHAGEVRVLSGASGALRRRIEGDRAGDELGHDLRAVGDVDGRGRPDLLVGAFRQSTRSYARVVSVETGETLWEAHGEHDGDAFGHSVGAADADGDGDLDWWIGAPNRGADGVSRVGAVQVFLAPRGERGPAWLGDLEEGHLGYWIGEGKADGDGAPAVALGSARRRAPGEVLVVDPGAAEPGRLTRSRADASEGDSEARERDGPSPAEKVER